MNVPPLFSPGYRYPVLTLIVAAIITGVFATALPDLTINPALSALVPEQLASQQAQSDIEGQFGSQQYATIYIEDDDLGRPAILREIYRTLLTLEENDNFTRIESVFHTEVPFQTTDGSLKIAPLLKPVPETEGVVEHRLKQGRDNPFLQNYLLAADGTAMAVNLYLTDRSSSGYYLGAVHETLNETTDALDDIVDRAYSVGSPRGFVTFSNHIKDDGPFIGFLALGAFLLIIGLSYRSLTAVLIPLLTSLTSTIVTLGFMAWVGYDITLLSWIIPIFLIVIGSTEDVHILNGYANGRRKNCVLAHLNTVVLPAVILTTATTAAGFFMLVFNDTPALYEFGISSGVGMTANFFLTVMIAPPLLSLLQPDLYYPFRKDLQGGFGWLQKRLNSGGGIAVAAIAAAAIIAGGYGTARVTISNTPQNYLPEDSAIRQDIDHFQQRFVPGSHLAFLLKTSGTFTDERALTDLRDFEQFLDNQPLVDGVVSFYDYIRVLNTNLAPGDERDMVSKSRVEQYLLLTRSRSIRSILSPDRTQALVMAHQSATNSDELRTLVQNSQTFLGSDTHFKWSIGGSGYVLLKAADRVVEDQFRSALLLLGTLLVVLVALTGSFLRGLILLTPNVLPVLVMFGLIGLTGTPIDLALTMIGVIVFGVAVDDTVHMITYWRYHDGATIASAVEHEFQPVTLTSTGIIFGGLALMFSFFPAIRNFGMFFAFAIAWAYVADLVLTPLLLSWTEP